VARPLAGRVAFRLDSRRSRTRESGLGRGAIAGEGNPAARSGSGFCRGRGKGSIRNLALFGSILRDDFRPNIDIDILVAFEPDARQGLLTLAEIQHEPEDRIGRAVDISPWVSVLGSENWIRRQDILATALTIYKRESGNP